ncbi:MAG TPA: cell division ATP-binding protein FtsE [Xylella sp.]
MSVLSFDHVSKQHTDGHLSLDDVSFRVADGEMLFVTGHSGAGKSTLLKLIQIHERPSRGVVLFSGRDLLKVRGRQIPFHRRQLGAVYQEHRLLMDWSISDNVALPLVLRGMRRLEIDKQVHSVLERIGLARRATAFPPELSAGEKQRVAIARAIISEPRLLIADEPTGNLDPTLAAEIMHLFAELPARGISVLVVSHDLALLKKMRKRVLILDHGRLVDDISPQDLAE